jgi:hypothetical protein
MANTKTRKKVKKNQRPAPKTTVDDSVPLALVRAWLVGGGVVEGERLGTAAARERTGWDDARFARECLKLQREVLAGYGFADPGATPGQTLTDAEKMSWQNVLSLEGNARSLADVEVAQHQMRVRAKQSGTMDAEEAGKLADSVVRLNRQKDALLAKIQTEARQMRKLDAAASAAGGVGIQVVVYDGPLGPEWLGGRDAVGQDA